MGLGSETFDEVFWGWPLRCRGKRRGAVPKHLGQMADWTPLIIGSTAASPPANRARVAALATPRTTRVAGPSAHGLIASYQPLEPRLEAAEGTTWSPPLGGSRQPTASQAPPERSFPSLILDVQGRELHGAAPLSLGGLAVSQPPAEEPFSQTGVDGWPRSAPATGQRLSAPVAPAVRGRVDAVAAALARRAPPHPQPPPEERLFNATAHGRSRRHERAASPHEAAPHPARARLLRAQGRPASMPIASVPAA